MVNNYECNLGRIETKDANNFLDKVKNDKGNISYENISAFIKENSGKFDDNEKEVVKLFSQIDKEQYKNISTLDGKDGLSHKDISIFAGMDGSKNSISISDSILLNSQGGPVDFGDIGSQEKMQLVDGLNRFEKKYFDYMAPDSDKNYDQKTNKDVDLSQIRSAKLTPFSVKRDGNFSIDIPKSGNLYSEYSSYWNNKVLEVEQIDENHSIQNPKSATPIFIEINGSKYSGTKYDARTGSDSFKTINIKGQKHSVISEENGDFSELTYFVKNYSPSGKIESESIESESKIDNYNTTSVDIKYNPDGSIASKTESLSMDVQLSNNNFIYTTAKVKVEKDSHVSQYEIVRSAAAISPQDYKDNLNGLFQLKTVDGKKVKEKELYYVLTDSGFIELNEAKKQAQLKMTGKKENYKPVTTNINGKDETIMCDSNSVVGKSAQWIKDVIDGKIKTVDKNGKEVPLKDVKDIFALKGGFNYEEVFKEIKKAQEKGVVFENLVSIKADAFADEKIVFNVASGLNYSQEELIGTFIHETGHKVYEQYYTTKPNIFSTARDYSQKEEGDSEMLGNIYKLSNKKNNLTLGDLQEAKTLSNQYASDIDDVQLYSNKTQSPEERNPLLEEEVRSKL